MATKANNNAFVQLCHLASREKWCWKIPCTTCGNHELNYALRELGKGRSPSDQDWVIYKGKRGLEDILGRFEFLYPQAEEGLRHGRSRQSNANPKMVAIVEVCAGANLKKIADSCLFPDWLGYLGIVLFRMRCDDAAYDKLTALWAWQLRDFVEEGSSVWLHLDECARLSNHQLSFSDLESVEFAMMELQRKNRMQAFRGE